MKSTTKGPVLHQIKMTNLNRVKGMIPTANIINHLLKMKIKKSSSSLMIMVRSRNSPRTVAFISMCLENKKSRKFKKRVKMMNIW